MYFIPQAAKCPKCKYKIDISPDIREQFTVPTVNRMPVCPKCWEEFIKNSGVPAMEWEKDKNDN